MGSPSPAVPEPEAAKGLSFRAFDGGLMKRSCIIVPIVTVVKLYRTQSDVPSEFTAKSWPASIFGCVRVVGKSTHEDVQGSFEVVWK